MAKLKSQKNLDKPTFEKLFKEFYPFLLAFARKYVPDESDCKDIIHNVFLNLWQKRDTVEMENSLKPYLFRSVYNRCLNHLRSQKRIIHNDLLLEGDALESAVESGDFLVHSELEMQIRDAVNSLPDKCRRIFVLSRFEEKKYKEIAKIEGVSIKTVEAQMTKALKLLREKLIDFLIIVLIFLENPVG